MYQGDCESSRPFLTKLSAQYWFFVTKVSIESGSLRCTAAKALSWGILLFWTDRTADPTEDSGSLGCTAAKALSWEEFSFWTDHSADPTDGMGKRVMYLGIVFYPLFKVWPPGQRVRGVGFTRPMLDDIMVFLSNLIPSGLSVTKILGFCEILQVFVIREDCKRFMGV